jgi:hypothetical protein
MFSSHVPPFKSFGFGWNFPLGMKFCGFFGQLIHEMFSSNTATPKNTSLRQNASLSHFAFSYGVSFELCACLRNWMDA